eukprot:CAMPEP_0181178642 /NCGR_PEP_ID=MMETSP1096-20121128/5828_1 /TAXON_ID=156174 ORGANISM="Chrysochromulina ericina, Strain CCMP281" /NCGR_SAMPLE_ID=MMETSP1096 /ASSEMBLY_ACC=CAM_ASM_000453 /LENGTH=65 /DNA_ID=CAMNT_0023266923 /DNA_START=278 /DNA_END=475 /DNA_ORIENTATION=+
MTNLSAIGVPRQSRCGLCTAAVLRDEHRATEGLKAAMRRDDCCMCHRANIPILGGTRTILCSRPG